MEKVIDYLFGPGWPYLSIGMLFAVAIMGFAVGIVYQKAKFWEGTPIRKCENQDMEYMLICKKTCRRVTD